MRAPLAALRVAALTTIFLLPLGGCLSKTPSEWGSLFEKSESSQDGGKQTFEVLGKNLGEGQEVSLSAVELVRRVAELTKANQIGHAAVWIERHPEASLEALASLDATIPPDVYRLIAEVYDSRTSARKQVGWTQVAELRQANTASLQEYSEARNLFKNRLSEGRADRALELDLTKKAAATKASVLTLDAACLEGTAYLLGERPREAVGRFAATAAESAALNGYQAAYLRLFESDARRRAGDVAGAVETWRQAVALCSHLVVAAPPVLDPVLWEKLSYLRPADSPWPNEIVVLLLEHDPLPGIDPAATLPNGAANPATAEIVVWHAIGRWYLERGHAQAALVSFKRAESAATADETRQWLRLRQARALAQLEQTGPATAILVSLLADKQSYVSRPASALLGSIYFQRGQAQKSLNLLKKAVDQEDGFEWPERSEAEADLGLAYLSIGDAVVGLDRLHRAQRRFESEGDREQLAIALENEIHFLEHTGKRRDVAAVRNRLLDLERNWK